MAFLRDETLCFQAAEQLVRMLEGPAPVARKGEDLPKADRAALLMRARTEQPEVAPLSTPDRNPSV